jgi:NAD(P)H dehydrogenase (quinone)
MPATPTLFITGATGQLGRLVIDALLETVPASAIVAGVRDPAKEAAVAIHDRGVEVRVADYSRPETLASALAGVDRLLLISGSELGQRTAQHRNVIAAAKDADVGLIAYTSILHADTSPLFLAGEHRETEAALAESGVPFVLLRNGWYTEVYTWRIAPALQHGAFLGASGEGRISSEPAPTMPGLRRSCWRAATTLAAPTSWPATPPTCWPISSPLWRNPQANRSPTGT